jgi:hypothetical protein
MFILSAVFSFEKLLIKSLICCVIKLKFKLLNINQKSSQIYKDYSIKYITILD